MVDVGLRTKPVFPYLSTCRAAITTNTETIHDANTERNGGFRRQQSRRQKNFDRDADARATASTIGGRILTSALSCMAAPPIETSVLL